MSHWKLRNVWPTLNSDRYKNQSTAKPSAGNTMRFMATMADMAIPNNAVPTS